MPFLQSLRVVGLAATFAASAACSQTPKGYASHDALKYLPLECPAARVYVDVTALWSAVGSSDFGDPSKHRGSVKSVLEAFKSAGINFGKDVQDLGVCATELPKDDDDPKAVLVALGGNLGGKDALKRYKSIIMALSHVDEQGVIEASSEGVPYLTSKTSPSLTWIAMPVPNVLVFSTGKVTEVAALKKTNPVSLETWRALPNTLVGFDYTAPVDEKDKGRPPAGAKGRLSTEGGDLVLDMDSKFEALKNFDNPKLDALRTKLADVLKKSDMTNLSEPVRSMVLEVRTDALHLRFKVAGSALLDAVKQAQANPKSLREVLGQMTKPAAP